MREFQCISFALLVLVYLFKLYIANQFTYPLQVDWVIPGVKEDLSTLVLVTHIAFVHHTLYLTQPNNLVNNRPCR